MKPKDALGIYGEEVAAQHLRVNGIIVLERNWRCSQGEIDLIARDGPDLVICEVKTRRSVSHGTPLEAISARKIRRMRSLALAWMDKRSVNPRAIRFDVIGVIQPMVGPPVITHIRGV